MRHRERRFHRCSRSEVVGNKASHHQVVLLQPSQLFGKSLGPPPHAHQAICFPISICQFSDDITLDRVSLPHLLNFVLERQVLVPLCSQGECVVIRIDAVQAISVQAIEDARGAREFAPLKVAREPPGQLIARRQFRQSPLPNSETSSGSCPVLVASPYGL